MPTDELPLQMRHYQERHQVLLRRWVRNQQRRKELHSDHWSDTGRDQILGYSSILSQTGAGGAFPGAQTSSQPIPVSHSPDLGAGRPWRTPGMLPHAHKDLNECNTYGSCSQMCVNTDGSYTCSCVEGYVLQPDNKSCKAKNEPADRPPLLLVASSETIEVLYLNGSKMSTRTPVKGSSILTLDYSYKEDTVCWIESRDLSSQLKCTKIMKTGELTDEWIINIAQYLHSGSKQMPLRSIPTFYCLMVKVERLILHSGVACHGRTGCISSYGILCA
ncbi:hypothetical protein Q9233_013858 [Columba guinea]|nr:hypothetical protein Q9233_013858 [Columba guinea]